MGTQTYFNDTEIEGPRDIALGPDGNLWFTNDQNSIGRITPSGVVTSYTAPGLLFPSAIAAGAGPHLWFMVDQGIGRIGTAGDITIFPAPVALGGGIAKGPDGNMWFTAHWQYAGRVGRITPSGVVSIFTDNVGTFPGPIAAGPGGQMWFSDSIGVGKVSMSGTVTHTAGGFRGIAKGPDGSMWSTGGTSVQRTTAAGVVSAFNVTDALAVSLLGIAAGPDGNMWVTAQGTASLFQVTMSGSVTEFANTGPGTNEPVRIAAGPDGNVWFTVQGSNSIGRIVPGVVVKGSQYHPVDPSRLLDSRNTTGSWNGALVAGEPLDLQVTGRGGLSNVPASAAAVVMNVTATGGSADSFLTVYPAGTATPNSSNLNFGKGQTIANLVTVGVGTSGRVSFANAIGDIDVVADVVGYYDDGTGSGDLYTGVTPRRLLDSRTPTGGWNAKLIAGTPRDLPVRQPSNLNGVPSTATAVIVNVTITGGTAGSFVSVWPSGVAQPNVSNLNFGVGQTIPNLAIVKIGDDDAIRIANAVGGVDVIIDVVGYFDPSGGSRFYPIYPTRILDDRVPTGLSGPWGPGQTRALLVAGGAGTNIPVGATGIVANVTATGGTAGSFITVFPNGVPTPGSSNLNFGVGQTIPNLVTVKVAADGKIAFYNRLGQVDIIADAVGYYSPS